MNTFDYAVLEIYEKEGGWPTEGTPSDWIDQKLVGYSDCPVGWYLSDLSLWFILKTKFQMWWADFTLSFAVWFHRPVDIYPAHLSAEEEKEIENELNKALHLD